MEYRLGENDTEFQVETADDYKDSVISMLEQAQHNISIFTQDLEPEIYNNKNIEQAIIRLAKRHPATEIRILVKDSRRSVQNGHCLIRLAQQLTSSVFIHNPSQKYDKEQSAFVVVDQMGLIYRALATDRNYRSKINFKSPRSAAQQAELFDDIWEHSSPDIQTRRIYM